MIELEVKAVVSDPAGLRQRLLAAGAVPGFRGLMADRRFDRGQTLMSRDEVLRIRRFESDDGTVNFPCVVPWPRRRGSSDALRERIAQPVEEEGPEG